MIIKKLMTLLVLFMSLIYAGQADAEIAPIPAKGISTTLSAKYVKGDLIAEIAYTNVSDVIIYLDKFDGGIAGIYTGYGFYLKKDGTDVIYMGPRTKRRYQKSDFVPIKPSETITAKVNLTADGYLKLDKKAVYTLYYSWTGFSGPDANSKTFPITSNRFEVTPH